MLLPALNKARSTARATECSGNFRQINYALCSYSTDFDDFILPSAYSSVQWGALLKNRGYLSGFGANPEPLSATDPLASPKQFHCPEATEGYTSGSNTYRYAHLSSWYVYGINGHISIASTTANYPKLLKKTLYKQSTKAMFLMEMNHNTGRMGNAKATYEARMKLRHSNKMNVLWLDGHVTSAVPSPYTGMTSANQKSFWSVNYSGN